MSDMIAYNLATVSNGKPLSSGGMIYIQPYAGGEKIGINPNRPLYIEIPTDDYNPEMQSWRGVVNESGDINWENPKDLQKFLVRIDLDQLDFLPPGFENAVHNNMPFRNHKTADKRLVDSLYYGLIAFEVAKSVRIGEFDCSKNDLEYLFGDLGYIVENKEKYLKEDAKMYKQTEKEYNQRIEDLLKKVEKNETLTTYEKKCFCLMIERNMVPENLLNIGIGTPKSSSAKNQGKTSMIPPIKIDSDEKKPSKENKTEQVAFCFIKPTSIKTLKTQEFSNTFIATKEFEDRIRALHGIAKSDSLLDLYVNNLAKNLWEVDALVAQRLQGEKRKIFENFAAQRCTNLKDADIHQERLSKYYATKREALAEENKKANALYQKKNAQELQKLAGDLDKMKGKLNLLNEQKATNASQMDVYTRVNESNSGASDNKQIPAFIPPVNNVVRSSNVYATPWFDAGWMNIDMYLKDINKNAVDVEFVASFSADKPAHFKIYQCLNTLKTLVPLNVNNNKALAKFPSKNSKESQAMTDTYAIGLQWKNDGSLALAEHKFNPYKTKSIDLQWEEISQAELSKRLKKLDYATDLLKHIEKQEKLILEAQRIKAETALMQEQIQQTKQKLEEKQKAIIAEIEFMKMLQRSIDVCEKSSQSKTEQSTRLQDELETVPLTRPEFEPQFPGGEQAMLSFINNNFNIPSELVIEDPKSKIYVQFFVEVDGSITEISVVRGIHPLLDAEAIRVVSIMPKFIPAQNKGVAVRQSLVLPMTLHLK